MNGSSVGDRPILLAECMLLGAGKCHFEFQLSWFVYIYLWILLLVFGFGFYFFVLGK